MTPVLRVWQKSGEMDMVLGVWMSTLVLAPLGAFFTYKSNNDSVVFNAEVYINFFRMLLGLRPSRHVFKKEVIIETRIIRISWPGSMTCVMNVRYMTPNINCQVLPIIIVYSPIADMTIKLPESAKKWSIS